MMAMDEQFQKLLDSRPTILPSILSADFGNGRADILDALAACHEAGVGGGVIHVDVMDGHLVPNISFGPPVIEKLRRALPGIFFDVHLMISDPISFARAHRDAGADLITFHVEATPDPRLAVRVIRETGARVGVTLKPGTAVESLLPVLDEVDLVLVMSVEPGFGGQSFMEDQLRKCEWLRGRMRRDQVMEIDGGMNEKTIGRARSAGVEWFVVGSAIFNASDRRQTAARMADQIRSDVLA
jgi:ribulose-phosphate 3-epimerase